LLLSNTASTAVNGGSSGSFVRGPLTWSVTNGTSYVFPTGKGTKWARVGLGNVNAAGAFSCEYYNTAYGSVAAGDLSTAVTPTLTNVSQNEYWGITQVAGTPHAEVTLYWEANVDSDILTCTDLRVAHFNTSAGNKWENQGQGACSYGTTGSITGTLQTSFSPETFGSLNSGNNPLPIELLDFSATYNGQGVDLNWQTATEINNNYFTIERSSDGINYVEIAKVSSKALNGNSTSILSYYHLDPNNEPGTYYYRLKQTDYDGRFEYSAIDVVVIAGSIEFSFNVAPNPNNGRQMNLIITSKANETVYLEIYDVLGQLIHTKEFTTDKDGKNIVPLVLPERLTAGMYIYKAIPSNHEPVSINVIVN
jgi:hypothetical protein